MSIIEYIKIVILLIVVVFAITIIFFIINFIGLLLGFNTIFTFRAEKKIKVKKHKYVKFSKSEHGTFEQFIEKLYKKGMKRNPEMEDILKRELQRQKSKQMARTQLIKKIKNHKAVTAVLDKASEEFNKKNAALIRKQWNNPQTRRYMLKHPYHMVKNSPWPFETAQTLFVLVLALVNFFHFTKYSAFMLFVAFIIFLLPIFFWFRDIIRESTYMGVYTLAVQKNLRIGMVLFIISEIMFFFSLFWAFFHFSLSPSIWIGCVWPPYGITTISPWSIPLLNTIILVSSGLSVTFAHKALCYGHSKADVIRGLLITIFLGLFFMMCQLYEFRHAPFSINDSVYGSIFFMITGFHGLHVIIGTIFLIVNLCRVALNHFLTETHLGFEFSIWYWHFVDVIRIFVYLAVYWWGGN